MMNSLHEKIYHQKSVMRWIYSDDLCVIFSYINDLYCNTGRKNIYFLNNILLPINMVFENIMPEMSCFGEIYENPS